MKHKEKLQELKKAYLDPKADLENYQKTLKKLQDDISWFEKYDSNIEQKKRNDLESQIQDYRREIKQCNDQISSSNNRIKEIKGMGLLQLFLSAAQILPEIKNLYIQVKNAATRRNELEENIRKNNEKIANLQQLAQKYQDFDKQQNLEEQNNIKKILQKLESIVAQKEKEYNVICSKIEKLLSEYSINELEWKKCQDAIEKARKLNKELSDAENSYEKAMIHNDCENRFGCGSPGKVIAEYSEKATKWQRKMKKCDERICQKITALSRKIDIIVIDGNNLCYKDKMFLGLAPVVAVANYLSRNYQVTVIFDHSIIRNSNMSEDNIKSKFASTVKEVHIVSPGRRADDTILTFADSKPDSAVISNDVYDDYPDKSTIQKNRVIKFENVGNQIIIHDLDAEIVWEK